MSGDRDRIWGKRELPRNVEKDRFSEGGEEEGDRWIKLGNRGLKRKEW